MFSSILRPCSRLDAKNSYPNSDVSLSYWTVPGKWYPILGQNSLISIPYPRLNCSKTLPFTAAHTYIAYIWEYPPWRFRLFLVQLAWVSVSSPLAPREGLILRLLSSIRCVHTKPRGGGTSEISGWGCAAGTLEPLTYTRASSAEFCHPILE